MIGSARAMVMTAGWMGDKAGWMVQRAAHATARNKLECDC